MTKPLNLVSPQCSSHTTPFNRTAWGAPGRVLRATTAMALGGLVLFQAQMATASAVNATPILVVHGFDADFSNGINCKDPVMLAWVQGLQSRGFTRVKTIGWYKGDVNCDLRVPGIGNNTVDTSLDEVGREFANLVSDEFGTTTVAISAHSMGGLVVRRALHGVQNGHSGFPTNIRVSDVVTSGTPHAGTQWGRPAATSPPSARRSCHRARS